MSIKQQTYINKVKTLTDAYLRCGNKDAIIEAFKRELINENYEVCEGIKRAFNAQHIKLNINL